MDANFSDLDMELWDALGRAEGDRAVFLLSQGVSPHSKNPQGESLLGYACKFGHFSVIDQLLERGAEYPSPPGLCLFRLALSHRDPPLSTLWALWDCALEKGWDPEPVIDHIIKDPDLIEAMGLGFLVEADDFSGKKLGYRKSIAKEKRIKCALGLFLTSPRASARSISRRL